jgi:hypothetical protein
MDKKEYVGTKHVDNLDAQLDRNQSELVDILLTPHPKYLGETRGAKHRIVCSVPAYNHEAQPVQARGRIVWNEAYRFQAHGPSYLDPVPDPGRGGGY